jgi:5-hydroxyisourate hydrolase-like protein (transthyretin family)
MNALPFLVRLIVVCCCCLGMAGAGPREEEWKKVAEARANDQPQTVIELLSEIEKSAFAEGAWMEGTRALASRIAAAAEVESLAVAINQLEAAVDGAPEATRPVLRALAATWLHSYYQLNQWQLMRRSTTDSPVGDDLETWDLARILSEIDTRFQKSLADAEALKVVPVADFAELLTTGSLGDAYRPTMYDFVAHVALDFYTSEEVAVSRPVDDFRLGADSPVFGTTAEFLAWRPEEGFDVTSPKARALAIYQSLLEFHQNDETKDAFLVVDLERLRWADEAAEEKGRDARFERALERLIAENPASPVSAWARVDLAGRLNARNATGEAHAVLEAGVRAFSEHPFGKLCEAGVASLEQRKIELTTASTWTPGGEDIRVMHRNLERVWFRLYSVAFRPGAATLERDPIPRIPDGKPVKEWVAELVDERDYQLRSVRLPAPDDVAAGYYLLVASAREDFSREDNQLAVAGVHVTSLAMTTRLQIDGSIEGYVVDAVSGAPVADIQVGGWFARHDLQDPASVSTKTDAEGRFQLRALAEGGNFLVVASRGLERAVSRGWTRRHNVPAEESLDSAVMFTDRAIYRPGQTVFFKGICCRINASTAKYETIPNKHASVVLNDPNGKEVSRLAVVSNARGSFSGTFIAPEGGVLGICRLSVEGNDGRGGGTSIRVEEYKRPKFFTEIDPPAEPAALGQEVAVNVRAEAYTGAPVDGAKVTWRVTRMTRLPVWMRWCWWAPPVGEASQEIAHGTAETAADGSVMVRFTAQPDGSVREDLEPVFDFHIAVDVTDSAGETRSATRRVSVAYTALKAELTADDWLEAGRPLELGIFTQTHDHEGRAAKGVLKIHRLIEPEHTPRPDLAGYWAGGWQESDPSQPSADPDKWEPGELVAELAVETDAEGKAVAKSVMEAGAYRLIFETRDSNGKAVKAIRGIQVVAPDAPGFTTNLPFYVSSPEWSVEPGREVTLLWGSGYPVAQALIEWRVGGKLIKREWSTAGRTQQVFRLPIEEQHRGGVTLDVIQVTMNRLHRLRRVVDVPWTNKTLNLRWEHLVSKLEPGSRETWTAVIESADGEPVDAEMVATLYDASLDAFTPHGFQALLSLLRREWDGSQQWNFTASNRRLEERAHFARKEPIVVQVPFELQAPFRWFIEEVMPGGDDGGWAGLGMPQAMRKRGAFGLGGNADFFASPSAPMEDEAIVTAGLRTGDAAVSGHSIDALLNQPGGELADPSQVVPRANLQETAFFFPDLTSDADGTVRISFTMPEALTKWRFLGMAHDTRFRSGLLEGTAVTAKDLMVQPNPPRFLREGDELWFTVKITNTADREQSGTARLTLSDAATDEDQTAAMGIDAPELPFSVPAKGSRTLKWKIAVPDGAGFLRYQAVASSGTLSDGEEGWLPVIPRRILVTESLSLPIREAGTREFEFEKLLASEGSDTLENRFLHVQAVSQPAWYAVMALPYLMESPHESLDQVFNRYYANALARHIATSDPKIRRIFDLWKANGQALDSPLAKNADLKGILLEETPWLREATQESEARRRVGQLFEENHLERELEKALAKLSEMQGHDGLWSWFPGGRGDHYISLYITTGLARLRALGVPTDITPAMQALSGLDAEITRRHRELIRLKQLDKVNLDFWIAHYLYTRTFFLNDKVLEAENKPAFDYYVDQSRQHWTKLNSRMSRAHLALALHRLGDKATPALVTRSLKEHATIDEEQGMFWKDSEGDGWWWWQAPIETQAMMIESFREIDHDAKAVEECQVWLIKQKQVADWKTTRATADATWSLLAGGGKLLGSDAMLEVSLGGQVVKPEAVEAGTGFYQNRFVQNEVKPELGKITLTKTDGGVSWASVHWQYLEDMAKVTSHAGKQLLLEKALFVRKNTDKGPVLVPVNGPVTVGDELVTRVILKNDRAMEYVHLKDLRGSGTEPVSVLSGYRWQDGFGYYEVTRDTASHFFIDRLPPGTHVFETSVRVQHAGKYQAGIAEIRCMYAPEFNAHSGSVEIVVE